MSLLYGKKGVGSNKRILGQAIAKIRKKIAKVVVVTTC